MRGSLWMALGMALAGAAAAHIKAGSLNVKAGTSYTAGQKVSLSWAASVDHNKSNYNLWYSPDAGKTWTSVKTGIPGAANNVPVTYEWTVPATPTKTGMIRVFQTFGGAVASDPSRPGDYTLFSPTFEIAASTSVAPRATRAGVSWMAGVRGTLSLSTLDGRVLRSVPQDASQAAVVPTSGLPKGVYVLRFQEAGAAPATRTFLLD